MKRLRSWIFVAGLVLASFCAAPLAHAAYLLTVTQANGNVVASGAGTINLAGLTRSNSLSGAVSVWPEFGQFVLGTASATSGGASGDYYTGFTSRPDSYGSGTQTRANIGVGDFTGVIRSGIGVPPGNVSNGRLASTVTFNNATYASLGYPPATYTYAWGTGANADSLTITGAVPAPSTWALPGAGAVGAGVALRWRRAPLAAHSSIAEPPADCFASPPPRPRALPG